jgi:hypothetical protein
VGPSSCFLFRLILETHCPILPGALAFLAKRIVHLPEGLFTNLSKYTKLDRRSLEQIERANG